MLPSEIPSRSQAIDNNRYSQIHLVPGCLAAKTDPTQKVRTIVLSIESECLAEVMYLFHTDTPTMFCNVTHYVCSRNIDILQQEAYVYKK